MGQGPLSGIRLIELDAIGPVPLAGMILAGMGADVVQVGRRDEAPWGDIGGSVLHRGKTRIRLDLKDPQDRALLFELVERADGLIEGLRPGVMERLGIGPEACAQRNPRLVYARVTGWGQDGPLAQAPGHDINYLAMTGALHAIGTEEGPPAIPLNLIGDYAGGSMFAVAGLLAALLGAARSGKGEVIDVAMVDGVANLLALFQALIAEGDWTDRRGANLLDGGTPFYRCYRCADGEHVAVGALEPRFFARLLAGLDLPGDRFAQHDRAGWPAMAEAFAARFAERPRDEWARRFRGTDACVVPVLSLSEAMVHPDHEARSLFVEPGGIRQAAPAPRFQRQPGAIGATVATTAADALRRWERRD